MHQYGAHPSSAEETQPGSKQCENPRFHLCKEQGSVSKVFAMQTGHALPSPQTQVKKHQEQQEFFSIIRALRNKS